MSDYLVEENRRLEKIITAWSEELNKVKNERDKLVEESLKEKYSYDVERLNDNLHRIQFSPAILIMWALTLVMILLYAFLSH